jgi:hypothetical protein
VPKEQQEALDQRDRRAHREYKDLLAVLAQLDLKAHREQLAQQDHKAHKALKV